LDELAAAGGGDVWLWSLAHDVFARARFKTLALSVLALARRPLTRAFSMLRLYPWIPEIGSSGSRPGPRPMQAWP
jgi:hypothetical protein